MNVFHQLPTSSATYGFTLIKSGSLLSALHSTNDNKSTAVDIAATNVSNYFYPDDFSGKSSGDVNF
jgi:hypothetical protein